MEFAETCIASDAFVARSRGLILDLATREINPTMVHRPLPTLEAIHASSKAL